MPLPEGKTVFGRGGAVIVEPSGDVIAGPLYGEEGIVLADCDFRVGLHAKRLFDASGHYGREDTLLPLLAGAGPESGSASEEPFDSRVRGSIRYVLLRCYRTRIWKVLPPAHATAPVGECVTTKPSRRTKAPVRRGFLMGDPGFEPGTSALSERRSNQLS